MSRKTQLSQNPSFDLDFIGQVMRTEASVRHHSHSSLPRIESRYVSQESKESPRKPFGQSNQHRGSVENFSTKYVKRSSKEDAILKRKIEIPHEIKHVISVRKYGKWL